MSSKIVFLDLLKFKVLKTCLWFFFHSIISVIWMNMMFILKTELRIIVFVCTAIINGLLFKRSWFHRSDQILIYITWYYGKLRACAFMCPGKHDDYSWPQMISNDYILLEYCKTIHYDSLGSAVFKVSIILYTNNFPHSKRNPR